MMAFIEHNSRQPYPNFVWAKDISVKVYDDELEVSGTVVLLEEEGRAAPDFLENTGKPLADTGDKSDRGRTHLIFDSPIPRRMKS